MPLAIAIGVIVALLGFLLFAIAHEKGPSAPDVAIGYERAWDELNFGLLWDLSGPELREGLRRDQFIDAKRHASGLERQRYHRGAARPPWPFGRYDARRRA